VGHRIALKRYPTKTIAMATVPEKTASKRFFMTFNFQFGNQLHYRQ
jgi:hypothetical protein